MHRDASFCVSGSLGQPKTHPNSLFKNHFFKKTHPDELLQFSKQKKGSKNYLCQ
jgi:hypothetical protein